MIGMVLVTHGALAHEFKSALEHVVGPQDHVETIAIGPEDDMEQRREDIVRAVDAADEGLYFLPHLLGERSPWWNPSAHPEPCAETTRP